MKAEFGSSARDADGFRGPYQGLRGDTPHVYSGAADLTGLDEGDPSPQRGRSVRSRKAAQTGAEHDKIVLIHCHPPRRSYTLRRYRLVLYKKIIPFL